MISLSDSRKLELWNLLPRMDREILWIEKPLRCIFQTTAEELGILVPEIQYLMDLVSLEYGAIHTVWLNKYRNKDDWTPMHLDPNTGSTVILSLGSSRIFMLGNQELELQHGDLFVLLPEINRRMKHGVPKVDHQDGIRISIAFFCS